MSLQVAPSDDGELCQLHAVGEVSLPELHVAIARALTVHARHVLIDLRHAWIDADYAETTIFINYLQLTLLPKLDACDEQTVFLTHTIDQAKEPESHRLFQELKGIDVANGRVGLVSEIESALSVFAKPLGSVVRQLIKMLVTS